MAGLYVVADLGALGAAASSMAQAADGPSAVGALPSFGDPGADGAAADFARAAQQHAAGLASAAARGAQVLRGYVVAFHEIGD